MTVGNTSGEEGRDVESEEALYQNGDQFIYVKTATDQGDKLPAGQPASVRSKKAVIVTGLSGTVDGLWIAPQLLAQA